MKSIKRSKKPVRRFNGITIPIRYCTHPDLTPADKILLAYMKDYWWDFNDEKDIAHRTGLNPEMIKQRLMHFIHQDYVVATKRKEDGSWIVEVLL